MQELVLLLLKNRLSASQLVLLHCIRENIQCTGLIQEVSTELALCKQQGWLDDQGRLTPRSKLLLSDADRLYKITRTTKESIYNKPEFQEKITQYRDIFPNIKLPTGKAARTNIEDVKSKMAQFFLKYPQYNWDTILKATQHYVTYYSSTNYLYMRSAGYYIMKDNESDLANDCQLILEGSPMEPIGSYHIKLL